MKKLLLIGILCGLFSGSALSNSLPKGIWGHLISEPFNGSGYNQFSVEFSQNSFSVTCHYLPRPSRVSFELSVNGRNYNQIDLIIDGVTVKNPNNHKDRPPAIISKIQKAKTLQVVYKNGTISVPMSNKKALEGMSGNCPQK